MLGGRELREILGKRIACVLIITYRKCQYVKMGIYFLFTDQICYASRAEHFLNVNPEYSSTLETRTNDAFLPHKH